MRLSLKMVSSLIFPLQLHFSTVFVIFLTFQIWNGVNGSYEYEICSNSLISCGNITKIGYPFWGDHVNRPIYCGHPAMKLECHSKGGDSEYPILKLDRNGGKSFPVLGIRNFTITIPLLDLDSRPPHCLKPSVSGRRVTNLDDQKWVTYSSNVKNITLSYGCDRMRIDVAENDTISVCGTGTYNGLAYYLRRRPSDSEFCKNYTTWFPVLVKGFVKYRKGGISALDDVFSKGFDVEFLRSYSELCQRCRISGGECGSSGPDNLSQFTCYCQNGQYPDQCQGNSAPEPALVVPGTSARKKHAPEPALAVPGTSARKKHAPILENSYIDRIPPKNARPILIITLVIAIAAGLFILSTLILGIYCCKNCKLRPLFWKGRTSENQNIEAFLRICGSLAPKKYSYSSIRKMTNSFKDKLGEGGYAAVYKGKLKDGRFVAVKLFKQLKGNGDDFTNEVASIGKTNHVNIVSLLGFCFNGMKRALIYEFMPNGSLEKFIFRSGNMNCSLPCETVFNIAHGVARGLEYLHRGCNERILHFDIKPHNILLDENFHPKISDFGLARLCAQQESSISMLGTRGTIGYIAPEVFCRNYGSVSHKSDVYSYGMMVVDLVCGRDNTSANVQCSSEVYFPHWIYKQLELQGEVRLDEIVNGEGELLHRKMILVSLWCIQMDPSKRPSMNQVVEMLNGDLEAITMPPQPYISSPLKFVSYPSSETTQ